MQNRQKPSFLFVSAPFGGIEVFARNLFDVISRKPDIESTWVFIEWEPHERMAHLPPMSLNWTLRGGVVSRSRIHVLEKQGAHFDAAFFNHIIPFSFLGRFSRRVPCILSLDATPPLLDAYSGWYQGRRRKPSGFAAQVKKRFHTKRLYERASYLLPWSAMVRDSLLQDYAINPEKVRIVPPGINLSSWSHLATRKHSVKTQILFVGGDFMRKGGDVLLRLASLSEFRECEFHLVTRTFHGEPPENVTVHTALQPNSRELLDLYRSADIFALPSRADLSPNAVCEAMALQLPVVATDVGGLREIVADGENGYLVPADDEVKFADRLRCLVSSQALRNTMGQKGRALVESEHSIEKNAETIIELMTCASGVTRKEGGDQFGRAI